MRENLWEDWKGGWLGISVLHFPRTWHGRDLEIAPTVYSRREVVYGTRRVLTTLLKSLQEGVVSPFGA